MRQTFITSELQCYLKFISVTLLFVLSAMLFVLTPEEVGALEVKPEKEDSLSHSGCIFLPIVSYAPETRLAGGALLNYYFRRPNDDAADRPSTLLPAVIYTQNRQISAEISGDLYWDNAERHLNGYAGYRKFPDKFYGIGNHTKRKNEENYTPRVFNIHCNYQQKIAPSTYTGLRFEMEHNEMVEVQPGGLLERRNIHGSSGGTAVGLGVTLLHDTRNHSFFPSKGGQIDLALERFDRRLGSDYNFYRMTVDMRRYVQILPRHILAFQAYTCMLTGDPPFQIFPVIGKIGEHNLMRGYYQGRFRDKNSYVLQGEYRLPLLGRFGLAVFGALGEVASEPVGFNITGIHYTYGAGLRVRLSRNEKINLRMDFGVGAKSNGFYLTIGEAF